jgi:hypothetical protein
MYIDGERLESVGRERISTATTLLEQMSPLTRPDTTANGDLNEESRQHDASTVRRPVTDTA